jgi:quercetin dioxygenase-like cupin family protein
MGRGAYGRTSGTGLRGSRPLMERLMVFSLNDELVRMREEEPWQQGDRNSLTLAKDVDFRVMLTALRDGATLDEGDGDARVSLQVLEGRALVNLDGEEAELAAAEIAVVDAGQSWSLRAVGECALLLTLAWPREKASPR